LFIAEFEQSLIIGHIIKTPASCCMYHWDEPLVHALSERGTSK
jgi:hypothetical protein